MSSTLKAIGEFAYELVISGGYKKGGSWGGETCGNHVPLDIHLKETLAWLVLMGFLFSALKFKDKLRHLDKVVQAELDARIPNRPSLYRILDIVLGTIAVVNWCMVLCYKINLKSLVNLLQPCHLALLFQSYALFSQRSVGIIVALLSFPLVAGSGAALLFPHTSGLDQWLEEPAFWLQHYFIQSVPLYLLIRHNFLGANVIDFKTLLLGNWLIVFTHWTLFEAIDIAFHVNVNFFLCPAAAMSSAFDAMLPKMLMWPSYRTFIMWFFPVTSIPTSYAYVVAAKTIQFLHNKIFGISSTKQQSSSIDDHDNGDTDTHVTVKAMGQKHSRSATAVSSDHYKSS